MKKILAHFCMATGIASLLVTGISRADSIYVTSTGTDSIGIIDGASVTSFTNGALDDPTGIAFDPANGNLFVANSGDGTISEFTPTGSLVNSTYASGLGDAQGIAFDSSGNLYVADKGNGDIYEVPSGGGSASVFANAGVGINDLAFDKSGNLFVSTGNGEGITVITPSAFSAGLTVVGPALNGPDGLAFDGAGNLYVVNDFDPSVEKITSGSIGSTVIPASGSEFNVPRGIAFDSTDSYIFVADSGNGTVTEYNALTGQLVDTFTGFCDDSYLADPASSGSLPVPEPSTYAMLLGGVGLLLFVNRRRKLLATA